jgi:hypothetical protein
MPRIRLREIVLLLLPVLVIGTVAWYLSRPPLPQNTGPWRLVLDEVKNARVTPREVYDGFDTKIAFKAHTEGESSGAKIEVGALTADEPRSHDCSHIQIVAVRNGKERVVYDERKFPVSIIETQQYLAPGKDGEWSTLSLSLSKLSRQVGDLTPYALSVRGKLTEVWGYRGPRIWRMRSTPEVSFQFTVKQAGAAIVVSRASRSQPFKVVKTKVEKYTLGAAGIDTMVSLGMQVAMNRLNLNEDVKIEHRDDYITDGQGRRYGNLPGMRGKIGNLQARIRTPSQQGDATLEIFFAIAKLPPGRLTFHTMISVNDCWPLPVKVVLREK